jgi:hypothetical protein
MLLAGLVTDPIIEWSLFAIEWLLSLLPEDGIDWPDGEGFGAFLGEYAGPLDPMLPVEETGMVFSIVATVVMPIMLTYRVVMWVWGHLPFV